MRCLLLVLAATLLSACALPDAKPMADGTTIHDRPEPVTGSMLRRDRSTSNVKTADADSVVDGVRGSTAGRGPSGSGP